MAQDPPAVRERIRTFILDRFALARRIALTDDTRLLEGNVVDSLGVMDMVVFLEEEFGARVLDEDLTPENFQTVGALAELVAARSAGGTSISAEV